MKANAFRYGIGLVAAGAAFGAFCTTDFDPNPARAQFEKWVERRISFEPHGGKPVWVSPEELENGKPVIQAVAVTDPAPAHCVVIYYRGAIRIPNRTIATLKSVLQDYRQYPRIYGDAIARVEEVSGSDPRFETRMVLHEVHMLNSFAFTVRAVNEFTEQDGALAVKSTAVEIRESNSGNPRKNDPLPFGKDHGILWGLITVWRAQQMGPDIYAEYEAATLARSLDEFQCFLVGQLMIKREVPKSAEDSIRRSLVMTRDECERR